MASPLLIFLYTFLRRACTACAHAAGTVGGTQLVLVAVRPYPRSRYFARLSARHCPRRAGLPCSLALRGRIARCRWSA